MTYSGVVDGYSAAGVTVSLPSGSTGDMMVLVTYTASSAMGTPSGWTFETWSGGAALGGRRYVFSRVRQSGDTTVTLPSMTGSPTATYAIVSIDFSDTVNQGVYGGFSTSTWSLVESYYRDSPRFAIGLIASDDPTIDDFAISGDFAVVDTYIAGSQYTARLIAADVASGPMEINASGVWDAGGLARYALVFFSPEVDPPPTRGPWTVGRVRWPAA